VSHETHTHTNKHTHTHTHTHTHHGGVLTHTHTPEGGEPRLCDGAEAGELRTQATTGEDANAWSIFPLNMLIAPPSVAAHFRLSKCARSREDRLEERPPSRASEGRRRHCLLGQGTHAHAHARTHAHKHNTHAPHKHTHARAQMRATHFFRLSMCAAAAAPTALETQTPHHECTEE